VTSMLNRDRVYMLAADHRWQWEEWCDGHNVPRARIGEIKRLAYEGFLRARRESAPVRDFGALLIDEQYASAVIADALRDGIVVGTPAERPGIFPLAWASEPFDRALTGVFAKVLIRFRPEQQEAVRDEQFAKLAALQAWCRGARKPLVIEIIVPRQDEPEADFETSGRPALVAVVIRTAYARGLAPDFWKIEASPAAAGAEAIDAAIAEHPAGRQIILGKGADHATIERWFAAAAGCRTAVGFAIGRSVVWEPASGFLLGTLTRTQAADAMCANYLALVEAWEKRRKTMPQA
jgi:myo-inositol catabolism protein IolC